MTTACPSFDSMIAEAAQTAKIGEFKKTAKDRLLKLKEGVAAVLNLKDGYTDDKQKELVAAWEKLGKDIDTLKQRLITCYPDWKKVLQAAVCDGVLAELRSCNGELWKTLGSVERKAWERRLASDDLAKAADHLGSWEKINTWIQARLDSNKALLETACKSNTCQEGRFALYIMFVELIPWHESIGPKSTGFAAPGDPWVWCKANAAPTEAAGENCDDAQGGSANPPESAFKFHGYARLVTPNQYETNLISAADAWGRAGDADARTQLQLDELKTWVEAKRKECEAKSKPQAIRDAVREKLKPSEPKAADSAKSKDDQETQAA